MKNIFKVFTCTRKVFYGFLIATLVCTITSYDVKVANAETFTNIAVGKAVIASDTTMGATSMLTDGNKDSNSFIGVTQNLQWLQIDLGKSYNINKINLWHYYLDGRKYHDVIVRLSNNADFNSGVTTVFNNDNNNSAGLGVGTDAEYVESSSGKSINFNVVSARYVRLYTNGSSANIYNHYVEVEVYGQENSVPSTGKIMFDDFNYTSASDTKLQANGWVIRNDQGGPGPSGCSFSKNNISFLSDSTNTSNKIMRLTASTDGTANGTSQAEINTSSRKYLNGTYAARVRFTDSPISGSDGAGINETFFTISPLEGYRDPNYSELDFEYLPNGGWGETGGMWNTSWHTYTPDPWYQDSNSIFTKRSYNGWHTLVLVVANGYNTYYIDGVQVAKNGPANGIANYFLPRKNMTINFNLWFITGAGENQLVNSKYVEDVDWVFHEKDAALVPDEVNAKIKEYRLQGITFKDIVN